MDKVESQFKFLERSIPTYPANVWMMTFSDLVFLMITCFVLNISMGHIELSAKTEPKPTEEAIELPALEAINLKDVTDLKNQSNFNSVMKIAYRKDLLSISLSSEIFSKDSAELTFKGQEVTKALARSLEGVDQAGISVHSHAGLVSGTPTFPSAWELGTARSAVIARQFIDAGVDTKAISAIGYADLEFDSALGIFKDERVEIDIQLLK